MTKFWRVLALLIFAACALFSAVNGQVKRELSVGKGGTIEIVNRYGKIEVTAVKVPEDESHQPELTATGQFPISRDEIAIDNSRVEVKPENRNNRVDLSITVPERTSVKITTSDGEVRITGNLDKVSVTRQNRFRGGMKPLRARPMEPAISRPASFFSKRTDLRVTPGPRGDLLDACSAQTSSRWPVGAGSEKTSVRQARGGWNRRPGASPSRSFFPLGSAPPAVSFRRCDATPPSIRPNTFPGSPIPS